MCPFNRDRDIEIEKKWGGGREEGRRERVGGRETVGRTEMGDEELKRKRDIDIIENFIFNLS